MQYQRYQPSSTVSAVPKALDQSRRLNSHLYLTHKNIVNYFEQCSFSAVILTEARLESIKDIFSLNQLKKLVSDIFFFSFFFLENLRNEGETQDISLYIIVYNDK